MAYPNIDIKCIEINLFIFRYAKCGDLSVAELFFYKLYKRVGKKLSIFGIIFNKK